jgi:hypothetical protein
MLRIDEPPISADDFRISPYDFPGALSFGVSAPGEVVLAVVIELHVSNV